MPSVPARGVRTGSRRSSGTESKSTAGGGVRDRPSARMHTSSRAATACSRAVAQRSACSMPAEQEASAGGARRAQIPASTGCAPALLAPCAWPSARLRSLVGTATGPTVRRTASTPAPSAHPWVRDGQRYVVQRMRRLQPGFEGSQQRRQPVLLLHRERFRRGTTTIVCIIVVVRWRRTCCFDGHPASIAPALCPRCGRWRATSGCSHRLQGLPSWRGFRASNGFGCARQGCRRGRPRGACGVFLCRQNTCLRLTLLLLYVLRPLLFGSRFCCLRRCLCHQLGLVGG